MTLRRKILAVVISVFVVLTGVLFLVSRTVLLDGYRALENQSMNQHLQQVLSSLKNEWETLDTAVYDWAARDDAYAFVAGENDSFVETNLIDKTFDSTGLRLNLIMFLDVDHKPVFQTGYDWKKSRVVPISRAIQHHLTIEGLLNLPQDTSAVRGFVGLDDGLFLVCSRAILTREEGRPRQGTLVMGRKFDADELQRLGDQLQLDLSFVDLEGQKNRDDLMTSFGIEELGDEGLAGYVAIRDIYGQAKSIISVTVSRTIYHQGLASTKYLLAVVVGVGVVFVVVLVIALEKLVLSRLTEMNRMVSGAEGAEVLATPLPVDGNDELANFSRVLNDMLGRLRTTENELIRLERLSALGELAAGINHNLNNILVGVTVSSEFLLEDVEDPEIREHVEIIFRAGRQAGDLVAKLQEAMLGESDDGVLRSVNEVIQEAVEASQPRWKDEAELNGHTIEMVLELSANLPSIRGSSSGLYNLVLNLIFNAIDALPEGGTIEIKTVGVGDGIQLTVRDTGIGMTEETAKRVFDPFFTTKAQIGTGLGLSTVYNTVVGWGGKIDVNTVPGAGTVFTVWLPILLGSNEDLEALPGTVETTKGRVLVVDDQDVVTELVQDILSPFHEVTCTHSGQIAVDLMDGEDYDVVILDLGMPGIPGDQVARNIRSVSSDVALILITGWRLEDEDERLRLFDFHLKKPLSNLDGVRDVVQRAIRLRRERQSEIG